MTISQTGAWLTGTQNHHHDGLLALTLADFFSGKSVFDFGCGLGLYVRLFRWRGLECDGCDGNPHTRELTFGQCSVLDLSEQVDLGRTYDWVLSLEVGEHLPPQFEQTYIQNLHRHNREGVVISWRRPGQGGTGHVNERENAHIKQQFALLGYENDLSVEWLLRLQSYLPWYRNTVMVFRRKSVEPSGTAVRPPQVCGWCRTRPALVGVNGFFPAEGGVLLPIPLPICTDCRTDFQRLHRPAPTSR